MAGSAMHTLIQVSHGVRRTMPVVTTSTAMPKALRVSAPPGVNSSRGYSTRADSCTSSRMADG